MAKYFNIIGSQLPGLTSAEVTAWATSGLIDNDAVIDIEDPAIVYYDEAANDIVRIPFADGSGTLQSYAAQFINHSGALTSIDLIGLSQVIGVFVDGMMQPWVVNAAPSPGFTVAIDTVTGEVDPGFTWDNNTVIIQYTSTIPPSV